MSLIPVSEADLHAYADERLDAARRAEIEAWLAAHPEEAERVADFRRLAVALHGAYDAVLDEPLPKRLEGGQRHWARFGRAAAWVALGLGLGTLAGWQLHAAWQPAAGPLADAGAAMARRAAVAHAVYSPEVRYPVEVRADQEAHLMAWLSKRLGAPVRAPKLDSVGYSLMGGRLLPGDRGPAAYFMYQSDRGSRITLYVRTEATNNRETAFRYANEGNVRVFYWVDRKLGYALSSNDISKEDLLKVANAVYQQLNP